MAIRKAKSNPKINNAARKAKRYPTKECDAPISAEDIDEAGNDESGTETTEAPEEETSEEKE